MTSLNASDLSVKQCFLELKETVWDYKHSLQYFRGFEKQKMLALYMHRDIFVSRFLKNQKDFLKTFYCGLIFLSYIKYYLKRSDAFADVFFDLGLVKNLIFSDKIAGFVKIEKISDKGNCRLQNIVTVFPLFSQKQRYHYFYYFISICIAIEINESF